MKVEKILDKKYEVASINFKRSTRDAATVMIEKQIGALIVLDDDQQIVGIVTERDVLRRCALLNDNTQGTALILDIMTPKERLITAAKDYDLHTVMTIMTEHNIRHIPIFDNDRLISLVSIRDVVKILLKNAEFENKLILDYMETVGKFGW